MKSGCRLPACAKLWQRLIRSWDASAGEGRSDKIMRNKSMIPKSGYRFSDKIIRKQVLQ
jgi:hypothetical protein